MHSYQLSLGLLFLGAVATAGCSETTTISADPTAAAPAATLDPGEEPPSATGSSGGSAMPDGGGGGGGGGKDSGPPPPPVDPSLDTAAEAPALADPLRPSAPYECQGTAITSADVPALVAQGSSGVRGDSRKHSRWAEYGLALARAERTCTVATGCGTWHGADLIVDFPEYHRELVAVALQVAGNGDTYVENPLWNSHGNYGSPLELRKPATTLDLQLTMRLLNASLDANADVRTRMRIRATRDAGTGAVCLSAASALTKSTNGSGVTTETFWVGSVALPEAPRPVVPALDAAEYTCPTALSSDAEIATMFAAGQSKLVFNGASTSNYFDRRCHPITGCTAYTTSYRSSRLVGLEVLGSGFQVRLDNQLSGPLFPVKNGVFTVAAGDVGSVRGACMDEKRLITLGNGRYDAATESLSLERHDR